MGYRSVILLLTISYAKGAIQPVAVKTDELSSPFAIDNIRHFIAFRVFFNARFYYPVFTILFLDFGLTLEQFALLNAVWALTIVLLEVPSGALADIVGRRRLLIFSGSIMVVEISLLCFAPMGNTPLLFVFFLFNRVLSGTAEAAASGADEALAYDTLKKEGNIEDWARVLEKQMRVRSMAYMGAMIIGAAVYDPALMQRAAHWLGLNGQITQADTLRFPLFLTLVMAIMTLVTTLRMREVIPMDTGVRLETKEGTKSISQALTVTLQAGHWIRKTPYALVIIVAGLMFDHIIRMILTLRSQYLRLIELPEASFGLIGSGFALLGVFIPRIAFSMAKRYSPMANLFVMSAFAWIGFLGMTFFLPKAGLLPVVLVQSAMYMNAFFISHYLNQITRSHQRATVLSFKGLSMNLAYGLIGIFYSLLLMLERSRLAAFQPTLVGSQLERVVFIETFGWFPWYFLFILALFLTWGAWFLRDSGEHRKKG